MDAQKSMMISLRLDPDLLRLINKKSRTYGGRSELIRVALQQFLAAEKK